MLHYDTQNGLSDLRDTVCKVFDRLEPHAGEFDSIAVQGTSGLLIGSPVSMMLGKPLVIIREDEYMRCHHSSDVENARNAGQRVLFLDDQISSGATYRDVRRKLSQYTGATVVASYEYQYDKYEDRVRQERIPRQRRPYSLTRGW